MRKGHRRSLRTGASFLEWLRCTNTKWFWGITPTCHLDVLFAWIGKVIERCCIQFIWSMGAEEPRINYGLAPTSVPKCKLERTRYLFPCCAGKTVLIASSWFAWNSVLGEGYTLLEIAEAAIEVDRIKQHRFESIKNQKWDSFHAVVESAKRKVKKLTSPMSPSPRKQHRYLSNHNKKIHPNNAYQRNSKTASSCSSFFSLSPLSPLASTATNQKTRQNHVWDKSETPEDHDVSFSSGMMSSLSQHMLFSPKPPLTAWGAQELRWNSLYKNDAVASCFLPVTSNSEQKELTLRIKVFPQLANSSILLLETTVPERSTNSPVHRSSRIFIVRHRLTQQKAKN